MNALFVFYVRYRGDRRAIFAMSLPDSTDIATAIDIFDRHYNREFRSGMTKYKDLHCRKVDAGLELIHLQEADHA